MLGTMLLSLGLIGYTEHLHSFPAALLPVVFVLALVVSRTVVRPERNGQVARPEFEAQLEKTGPKADVVQPEPEVRQWQHAVDNIGKCHTCKLNFALSPMVYGPEAEVFPILDACFPESSTSSTTLRDREIILWGRQLYRSLPSDCSQKFFAGSVARAHQAECAAQDKSKPRLSDSGYGKILAGSYTTVRDRLAKPV